jgi:hypothetical protein
MNLKLLLGGAAAAASAALLTSVAIAQNTQSTDNTMGNTGATTGYQSNQNTAPSDQTMNQGATTTTPSDQTNTQGAYNQGATTNQGATNQQGYSSNYRGYSSSTQQNAAGTSAAGTAGERG